VDVKISTYVQYKIILYYIDMEVNCQCKPKYLRKYEQSCILDRQINRQKRIREINKFKHKIRKYNRLLTIQSNEEDRMAIIEHELYEWFYLLEFE